MSYQIRPRENKLVMAKWGPDTNSWGTMFTLTPGTNKLRILCQIMLMQLMTLK